MLKNPFARIGLSFFVTLFALNLDPDLAVAVFAASAVCCAICLFFKGLPDRGASAVLFLSAMAAVVLFTAAQKTLWEPALAMDRRTGTLRGEATGETIVRGADVFSVIRTDEGEKIRLVTKQNYDLRPGDRVICAGRLCAEQPRLSRAERVFLICWYPKDVVVHRTQRIRPADLPYYARRFLIEALTKRVGGEQGTVAAAMATGETEALSDEIYGAFKAAGIAHVVAVSGLHMNLIVLALYRFLRRILRTRRRTCAAVCLAAAWTYAAVAAFTPSATRACIMISAFLGSVLFERRVSALNSLGLAAFLILLFNPYAVCSGSFLLSFAATLGLLVIGQKLLRRGPFRNVKLKPLRKALTAVYATVVITFSANAACLPVFLYLGMNTTLACFVTNLLTFFAVAPSLITGLLTALPGVFGQAAAKLCRLCASYILFVANRVSRVSWPPLVSWQSAILFSAAGAVCLCGFVCRRIIRKKKTEPVTTKER